MPIQLPKHITIEKIVAFQDKILDRYDENKRLGLPRRDSFDQYGVFISEVMLQQTQVDRVIPKYNAFLEEAESFESLVGLSRETLLRLWSGLGFNSRAIRLQQAAQILLEKYEGVLPKDREELRALPGIGDYCSASLLAFVYNITAPVVDTNIRRVFIYELGVSEKAKQKELEMIAYAVTPEGRANDWNNALMDYGSLVATVAKTGIKPLGKQSKFAGSKRQVRGNVTKWLVKNGMTDIGVLKKEFPHESFDEILTGMIKDGLVTKQGTALKL